MDPNHTGDMLRHLEKQNELLMNSYRSMSHELHKLQVEEEMLMRKYYELMTAHGQTQKKDGMVDVHNSGVEVSPPLMTLTMNSSRDDLES